MSIWRTSEAYEEHARRGRTSGWRYVLVGLLGMVLGVVAGAAVLLPLQLAGLLPGDLAARMQDPGDAEVFFGSVGVMFLCLLVGFALAARWVQGKRFGDIVGRWRWREFGLGLGAWSLVLVLLVGLDALVAPDGFEITASPETIGFACLALLALVPQIFAEEFVFRGWLTQGLLLALRRPLPAAIVSGLIFGSVHIPNGVPQTVSATVFGVLMALLAMRLGGIAFTTGLHLANNFFGAVLVVSAQDVFRGAPGVLSQSTPQLMWFDVVASCAALAILTALAGRMAGSRPLQNARAEV